MTMMQIEKARLERLTDLALSVSAAANALHTHIDAEDNPGLCAAMADHAHALALLMVAVTELTLVIEGRPHD